MESEPAALDAVGGQDVLVRRLTPALRAAGAAAASASCCKNDAQEALRPLLAAHQRAMLAHEHGYHHSRSDSLVAARAALWQAVDGRDDVVLDYVRAYLLKPRMLAEALQALAAAAEERPDAAHHARRLWPAVMDLGHWTPPAPSRPSSPTGHGVTTPAVSVALDTFGDMTYNTLPPDIEKILEHLATMAAGYDNHLKWNEEAQLKADLMHNRRYWLGFDVELVRRHCRQLGMRTEDVRLIGELVSKAQAGRRLVAQRSYRDFRFSHAHAPVTQGPSEPAAAEHRTSREW